MHLRHRRLNVTTRAPTTEAALARRGMPANLTKNHLWFRNTVHVFERREPLRGPGCTALPEAVVREGVSFPILPGAPVRDLGRALAAPAADVTRPWTKWPSFKAGLLCIPRRDPRICRTAMR
jgi:hypothetical protein